jgi:hypothetical protein
MCLRLWKARASEKLGVMKDRERVALQYAEKLKEKYAQHPQVEMKSNYFLQLSVADPDPGSGTFLPPGSGIRNRFFPDPGSRIPPLLLRA